ELVDRLLIKLLPQTVQHRSFIVNDVEPGTLLNTDENMLTSVLSNLLNTTISHTQSNCIHVSAKFFGNIALIHLRDNDGGHDQAISDSLYQVEPLAEKLGGCITISNNKANGTTVAFSIFNQQQVA
ncbi:MAG: hypothetical protein ACRDEB_06090, partial [Chitinophagaceae bacterium]